MNKVVGALVGIVVLILGGAGYFFMGDSVDSVDSLRVASFNAEVFGDAKIASVGVDYYVDLINQYDLFFLLEIRDVDGSSFYQLCKALDGYDCYLSDRSGRSVSKEAVGVFVKERSDNLVLNEYDDVEDYFEREPISVDVDGVRYWVVHLNPDDVYREMESLEEIVGVGDGKTVVIGDMNADCDYYTFAGPGGHDSGEPVDFEDWDWVIGDDEDTTSGFSDCAYDRIISSGVEVVSSGVREIDARVSDHNLVWVEVK
ncbi:hypothetical protein HN935_02615 [archaeon]|jgi:deoxyribonuclease-1-like protein|nr:hypothetical protein [archaeon]